MPRLCLSRSRVIEPDGSSSWQTLLGMEDGGSTTDEFDGVEFHWTYMDAGGDAGSNRGHGGSESLELSFDAEHADTVLEKYVPFIMSTAEELRRHDRALKIFLNDGGMWHGINHHHPATFDTLAMDPALKQAVLDDLDRFLKRKEYYQRIGKAWKRGYLLYGPPGTGKSSLVAAMANRLRYDIYDLDLSHVHTTMLQWLLVTMHDKSILVIEDINCCCDALSTAVDDKESKTTAQIGDKDGGVSPEILGIPPPRARNTEVITQRFTLLLSVSTHFMSMSALGNLRLPCPGCSTSSTGYGRPAARSASSSSLPTTRTASIRRCCGRGAWTCTSTWASAAGRHSRRLPGTTSSSTTTPCSRRYRNCLRRCR
jgi:hypothetical protein